MNGTLVWGQDRIPWVDAILAGWKPDHEPPPGGPHPLAESMQGFSSPSTLDVYFDVSSPFAYLGMTQLPALAKLTGVTPRLHPILLGGLFRDIGQTACQSMLDVSLGYRPHGVLNPELFERTSFLKKWAGTIGLANPQLLQLKNRTKGSSGHD